jgi:uncharacterized membrane protein
LAYFIITLALAIGAGLLAFVGLRVWVRNDARADQFNRWGDWFAAWADRIFFLVAIAFLLICGTLAILRYLSFHTGYLDESTAWDLGQFNQLIWNSLHGRLLQGTFILDAKTFLGKSFTPILLALVPLYAVWADARVLLFVQSLGLTVAAVPLYWYARARIGRLLGLVIAIAFYLSPAVLYTNIHEFHEIAFATPVIAFAVFFLLRKHYWGLGVVLAIALLIKEEMAIISVGFGLYLLLVQRQRKLGLSVMTIGAIGIAVLLQYVIPFFRGNEFGSGFYYFNQGAVGGGGNRYGYLGHSLAEIVLTLLTRPDIVLPQLLTLPKLEYLLQFLVPLALLPILGLEVFALAFPTLGYSFLSTYPLQYSIQFSYYAPITAIIFFASVVGLERVQRWTGRANFLYPGRLMRATAAILIFVASIASYYFQSPGPFALNFQPWRYVLDAHSVLGNELMQTIPNEAVVIAQNEYLAHLATRQFVYEPPAIPDHRQADYIVADTTRVWYPVHRPSWEAFASSGFFETLVQRDGFWIARPRTPDHALAEKFGAIELLGYSIVPTGTLRGGTILQPVLAWRANESVRERLSFAIRVVDSRGHIWASDEREPHDGKSPTDQWKVGKVINDQYALRLPPTMPSDDYTIRVQVRDQEIELMRVHIEKSKASFTASELYIENPLQVDMREMRLLGFVSPRSTIAPGELLSVGVYWRARAKPQGDYVIAIQLRDASGKIAFEQASRPANDAYPTTHWDAGEVLLDWHDFNLPRDLVAGNYQIFVAMRERENSLGEIRIAPLTVVK